MKILVVGSGGREHALVWTLGRNRSVSSVLCAPGNAGIARLARTVPVDAGDVDGLLDLAIREQVDLTVVGPELPLDRGIVDLFSSRGLRIFGPTAAAARLECSKVFAKDFMAQTRHSYGPLSRLRPRGCGPGRARPWRARISRGGQGRRPRRRQGRRHRRRPGGSRRARSPRRWSSGSSGPPAIGSCSRSA